MVKSVKSRKRKIGKYHYKGSKKSHNAGKPEVIQQQLVEPAKRTSVPEKVSLKDLKKQGLMVNLNKAFKPKLKPGFLGHDDSDGISSSSNKGSSSKLVSKLKSTAEAEAKRPRGNRVPPLVAESITYFLDKYGEDYEAMSRDYRNYDQETPNQLRKKVNMFKKCHSQYANFLKNRNAVQTPIKKKWKKKSQLKLTKGKG